MRRRFYLRRVATNGPQSYEDLSKFKLCTQLHLECLLSNSTFQVINNHLVAFLQINVDIKLRSNGKNLLKG